ncbi:MAG: alpha/beta fold hydrolase [Chitinophagaceae bacterium]|nr:alpha/beta fold hydrolase [Chitinophagaceae bacterium]
MKVSTRIALGYTAKKLQLISAISTQKAAQKAFKLFCTPQKRVQKKPSPIIDKAAIVHLKMDGLNIYGYRWNHPAQKKVLIAHGFESSAINFEGFVLPLIKKGYEVMAFDAPAHGLSDGKQIMLPVYINMLNEVHKAFGPFDAYIAHSLGGLAVVHFLQNIPHHPDTRLVLLAPATEITSVMDRFFSLLKLNDKVRQAFNKWSEEVTGISMANAAIHPSLKNIQAKILWLHDTEDDITPYKDVEKIKPTDFPGIKFIVSSGLGHRKIYRDAQSVKAITDFLYIAFFCFLKVCANIAAIYHA